MGHINPIPKESFSASLPLKKQPNLTDHTLIDDEGYTPTVHFFQQQLKSSPVIQAEQWSLTLGGLIETAPIVTYADLLARTPVTLDCTLACGHSTNNPLIGHARWQGVSLRSLFNEVELLPEARFARFDSADGYSTSIALNSLEDALIAYGMNGDRLLPEHGFPARLIVPGLAGYKLPKWITRIEFSASPYLGFWEQRGWSTSGIPQTTSAILSPRQQQIVNGTLSLMGIAYAGTRKIIGVEITIDDGSWMPVTFSEGTIGSWVRWAIDWQPPAAADYVINVRATDDTGFVQSENLHQVIIQVASV
jgi:DMSO/TMAO reductase YedYZ molybdopterin-dependent catalytic subunit